VGRLALALDPGVLAWLARGRTVVLVSGTNGKTTTSHLLAAALGESGAVAHNASGSNMADGAVAALAARPGARWAVLEVDELHLGEVACAVAPAVMVLLNLTRDQLDRVSEVRATAAGVGEVLAADPLITVVANADDPLTVWAAARAGSRVWVAAGGAWRDDAASCPRCGELLERTDRAAAGPPLEGRGTGTTMGPAEDPPRWRCTGCGLARPQPAWWWDRVEDGIGPSAHHVVSAGTAVTRSTGLAARAGPASGSAATTADVDPGGVDAGGTDTGGTDTGAVAADGVDTVRLAVGLPGRFNVGNALMALAAADAVGVEAAVAARGLSRVEEVAGRYLIADVGAHRVRLLLMKNPAGWVEALDVLAASRPLVVVINAREADGRDVSWLWDLPVEQLAGRPVGAAGERYADLGVRLSYAGIDHVAAPDPLVALAELPPGEVDVVANYTAFLSLRDRLRVRRSRWGRRGRSGVAA